MPRFILLFFILAFCFTKVNGQFGFQSLNGINDFTENANSILLTPSNSIHFSLGPSYWFRLKNKRVEFNPALLFDYSKSNYSNGNSNDLTEHSLVFSLPVLIYPFDFSNDCNCPTFNKSGELFKKGFHFIIYSSLPYSVKEVSNSGNASVDLFGSYQLGLGAGLDIGINKKFTFSPSIVLSKTFQDTYLFNKDENVLIQKSGDRIRLDLMLRVIWFQKKKRY